MWLWIKIRDHAGFGCGIGCTLALSVTTAPLRRHMRHLQYKWTLPFYHYKRTENISLYTGPSKEVTLDCVLHTHIAKRESERDCVRQCSAKSKAVAVHVSPCKPSAARATKAAEWSDWQTDGWDCENWSSWVSYSRRQRYASICGLGSTASV